MNATGNTTLGCNEEEHGPVRSSLYILIPVIIVYVIIFITGIVGNISTCIVIARNKGMHTATNYYLFSLAISDLLLLITGLPVEIYLMWYRYPYIFGRTFCFLRGVFAETSGNATVLTITAFTVERYLAICHPFLSQTMSKLSRAIKLILVIWILAIVFAVPLVLPVKISEDKCPRCVIEYTLIDYAFEVSTVLFFFAPMALITVLYVLIGLRLKSSRTVKRRISSNARIQSRSSKKVVKMLAAVVVAFFICWAPFHVQRVFTINNQRPEDEETHRRNMKIYEAVTYISGILYYVSATINPILYNIMSVKFREAFKETFSRYCGFSHLHHGKPQRSYSVLSRSNVRAPDSTDSGSHDPTIQTNSTLVHKNSVDSFNGHGGRRHKLQSSIRSQGIQERSHPEKQKCTSGVELQPMSTLSSPSLLNNPTYLSVHIGTSTPTTLRKFLQFFHCIAKRTLDDSKRLSSYYSTPIREPTIMELEKTEKFSDKSKCSRCDNFHAQSCISNSSLKDIENGAIEDELTAYMKEIRRREICS